MSARLHDRAGSVLRGVGRNSSKIAGLVIEREEYPCGRVSWDIKRAPLVAFMAFAAIAGFAVAANLQDGAAIASKPPMKAEGAAAQPHAHPRSLPAEQRCRRSRRCGSRTAQR